MKRSIIYSLLFGIPGILISFVLAGLVLGMQTGFFWIFLFGDDPWPLWTELVQKTSFILVFFISFIVILKAGYSYGKRGNKK